MLTAVDTLKNPESLSRRQFFENLGSHLFSSFFHPKLFEFFNPKINKLHFFFFLTCKLFALEINFVSIVSDFIIFIHEIYNYCQVNIILLYFILNKDIKFGFIHFVHR